MLILAVGESGRGSGIMFSLRRLAVRSRNVAKARPKPTMAVRTSASQTMAKEIATRSATKVAVPGMDIEKMMKIPDLSKPTYREQFYGKGGIGDTGGGGGKDFEESWKDVDACNDEFFKKAAKALKDLLSATVEEVKGDEMSAKEHAVFHEQFENEMEKAYNQFTACLKKSRYVRESASDYAYGVLKSKAEDNMKEMLGKIAEDL